MEKAENKELENEILKLIERKTEGVYWDFKQQWYSRNIDLLHDILCMANNPANRDAYIIIGIEDGSKMISDVSIDDNRKNQQNVIDLIREKPRWAGGNIPEVYVQTILISDKEIDIIIVKQSDNTPFYLVQDYNKQGVLYKGNIYTRKGDTNTPKTNTADLYDAEILWKRRFGLLYNPSQRAKNYLADLKNWERVDGKLDKSGTVRFFFYYKNDPDYTIHFTNDEIVEDEFYSLPNDINDESLGASIYYLFAFCNVSYHKDFSSNERSTLYYKDVPLFSSQIESIDEGRSKIIPPELWTEGYFLLNSYRYFMFEFLISYWSGNYAQETKQMLLRVIPLYKDKVEYKSFNEFIKSKGFSGKSRWSEQMSGEALTRYDNTIIEKYEFYGHPSRTDYISTKLQKNPSLVINFASPENRNFDEITKQLRFGKMLVDWLREWRINDN